MKFRRTGQIKRERKQETQNCLNFVFQALVSYQALKEVVNEFGAHVWTLTTKGMPFVRQERFTALKENEDRTSHMPLYSSKVRKMVQSYNALCTIVTLEKRKFLINFATRTY